MLRERAALPDREDDNDFTGLSLLLAAVGDPPVREGALGDNKSLHLPEGDALAILLLLGRHRLPAL